MPGPPPPSATPDEAATPARARSPWLVLVALCLAVFLVNVATTIVNIALPSLVTELDASTRDLLWIVDGFNLAFSALVLAAGSLSDRFGRRKALVAGLVVFGAGSFAGAWSGSPDELLVWRVVTGAAAAVIYPTTLSIIVTVFPDRADRAKAIGIWGAATGAAVALGPVVGGWLVQHYWWGSVLVFCGGVAVLTLVLTLWLVPDSRDPSVPALDVRGLVLSTAGLGLLVHAIIEAPDRGWGSPTSLVAFAAAVVVLVAFVLAERRTDEPMLDVGLFKNMRFTAASGAVTVSFFALFGFIFLITQYFQLLQDYGPFETGLRILPVATFVAITSIVGTKLAVRFGNKLVVGGGLMSLVIAYTWISTVGADTNYWAIAGQMVFLGSGMGLTSAPATEAIMGVVPRAKAGIGSAVNDATRELGGTLGVAVIGSVALSLYADAIAKAGLPADATEKASESVGAAREVGERLPDGAARALERAAESGFLDGLQAGCLVAAGVALLGAILVFRFLPSHPGSDEDEEDGAAGDDARLVVPGPRGGPSTARA